MNNRVLSISLELAPLDVLQAVGAPSDLTAEETSVVNNFTPSVAVPPPNLVVASVSNGPEGIVADDVAIRLTSEFRIDLPRRLRRAHATGKAGEVVKVELEDDTTASLIVLGLGDGSPSEARISGAKLAANLGSAGNVLCSVSATMNSSALAAFCEGLLLASYSFSRKSRPPEIQRVVVRLAVASVASAQPIVNAAVATANAVVRARNLANRPSNEKSPQIIADEASKLAAQSKLRVRVLDEIALEKVGFGGLLAVGMGSARPPRLVFLEHKGMPGASRVILIGKGITFDSGGLSLKPAEGMPLMKTDMSGAATVLSVMGALADLGITANVVAMLALAENMPSGSAYRPGDVVTHFGGRTSEVVNTDAEGRMVLADCLAYASARLNADIIIDIATLTGAASVGLSRKFGALYAADDDLANQLVEAGEVTNDRLWRMPLVEEYRSSLDSSIADVTHVTGPGVGGGSITAALFLREFVGQANWAHLDIAGPARAEASANEITKGATGFGVRLLLRWLADTPSAVV